MARVVWVLVIVLIVANASHARLDPQEENSPPSEKDHQPPGNGGGDGKSSPPSDGNKEGQDGKGASPPGNDHGSGDKGNSPPSDGDKEGHEGKGAPPPEKDHGSGDGKDGKATPPKSSPPTPPSFPPLTPPSPVQLSPPPPPNDSSEAAGASRKRCKNKNFPQCYDQEHVCPSSCPKTCQVDCVTCKPVCNCDMPGAVCQDPRFIGGDGITFYFHGKRNQDFCLVTDTDLHINAHFIGKRNENMKRDFTWVQSIGILFGKHQLFVGAQKTAVWNDEFDRLSLVYDAEPLILPPAEGVTWQPKGRPSTTLKRDSDTNSVIIKVDGVFEISAKVVPITDQESKIHNYGIKNDDCFAHLELRFKFFSLSGKVHGVLGQTYRSDYVSRVKMGVPMPVIGGEEKFSVSSLYATDCAVSQFQKGKLQPENNDSKLPSIKCADDIDGMSVCKR